MRDPEPLVSLLSEMSQDPSGHLVCPRPFGMSQDEHKRHHHIELLVDAGHATRLGKEQHIARITNDDYDFLNAVDKQPAASARFLD